MSRISLVYSIWMISFFTLSSVSRAADFSPISLANCQSRLSAIPRPGLAQSYSVRVRLQEYKYRISLALKTPSAQSSEIIIQIFWDKGMRHRQMENFIYESLAKQFKLNSLDYVGNFLKISGGPVDRDAFNSGAQKFEAELGARYSSPGKIYNSLSPLARSKSPEVMEAASRMTNLLRRYHIVNSNDEADRILNRAQARLIEGLGERQLRFFDYSLFDEVMSYEKDAQMQKIAADASTLISVEDRDYLAVQAEIRQQFLDIAQDLVQKQRQEVQPHTDRVNESLKGLVQVGQKLIRDFGPNALNLGQNPKDKEAPRLPFSRPGFEALAKLVDAKTFSVDNVDEYRRALKTAGIGWYYSSASNTWADNKDIQVFYKLNSTASGTLDFLATELEQQRRNEPSEVDSLGNRMGTRLTAVPPGNGSDTLSLPDWESGFASSFVHQPRRLNSGNGNRKERFDYDTPELD